jgi:hypothetical protein
MKDKSIFLPFAGCELSPTSKVLLIQESLVSKSQPIETKSPLLKFKHERKKSTLTRSGFPVQGLVEEKVSDEYL